eukprot:COSAG02_NODE_2835_length_7924_cov_8.681534_5_plen_91_part_00
MDSTNEVYLSMSLNRNWSLEGTASQFRCSAYSTRCIYIYVFIFDTRCISMTPRQIERFGVDSCNCMHVSTHARVARARAPAGLHAVALVA